MAENFVEAPTDQNTSIGLQRVLFSPSTPVRWIMVAVALVCMVIVGLEGWQEKLSMEQSLKDIDTSSINLARSLAQHADDTFELADTVLLVTCERLMQDGTAPATLSRLGILLQESVAANSRAQAFFVYGSRGEWLASSRAANPVSKNNSDREYFKHHSENSSLGPRLGLPIKSRFDGRWVIPLTRRFNNKDGTFAGLVLATIDISSLSNFYSTFDVGREGSILLANANGIILARHPYDESYLGRDLSHTPIFAGENRALSSTSRSVSPLDGILRLFGFQRGIRFPIVAIAAVSENEALAAWRWAATKRMILTALLISFILALAAQLVSYVRRNGKAVLDLARLSRTDALTKLSNRRDFDEKLADEWERHRRDGTPLSLVMIDLDRFKLFNDTYGHQAGDDCLRRVAKAVRAHVSRPRDVMARIGGEELAALLPQTDRAGAIGIAERIRSEVQLLLIEHVRNMPSQQVTISAGVGCSEAASSMEELVSQADAALYGAKARGRDRISCSSGIRHPSPPAVDDRVRSLRRNVILVGRSS